LRGPRHAARGECRWSSLLRILCANALTFNAIFSEIVYWQEWYCNSSRKHGKCVNHIQKVLDRIHLCSSCGGKLSPTVSLSVCSANPIGTFKSCTWKKCKHAFEGMQACFRVPSTACFSALCWFPWVSSEW
jgi:hypothetical protein